VTADTLGCDTGLIVRALELSTRRVLIGTRGLILRQALRQVTNAFLPGWPWTCDGGARPLAPRTHRLAHQSHSIVASRFSIWLPHAGHDPGPAHSSTVCCSD